MNEILDLLVRTWQNVPLETVIQALAAAGVLSVILLKIRKWFEVQSSGVVNFINLLLSGAVIMIQGLMSAAAQNPTLIPGKALGLMSLTILVYHTPYIGIKALADLAKDVKTRREQKARIADKNAVPAEVPIETVVAQFTPDAPQAIAPVTAAEFAPVE